MPLRAAFGAIVVGLLAALGIFLWTEYQTGRIGDVLAFLDEAKRAGPPPVVTRPPEPSPTTAPRPSPTARPAATSVPTRAPTATPRPTAVPTKPTGPTQVGVSVAELDAEIKKQVAAGGLPLQNPSLRTQPPDRLTLSGSVQVAIFIVPVEIEAQLSVDENGAVRVTTTRVEAVGASLPESVTTSLGSQVDDLGSQAVQAALPPGARAQRVTVDEERVAVELAAP